MNVILCPFGQLPRHSLGWGLVLTGVRGGHLVFLFPREALERTRLKFSLQGGKVTALCPQEGEQVWALNVKRAVMSMLQTSHTSAQQEVAEEARVVHVDVGGLSY